MKFFLTLLFILLSFQTQLFSKDNKSILILNSYHKGFKWSDDIIQGIEEIVYDRNIDLNILYMDSKRIASKEYYEELRDLYKLQLKNHSYDLIIAVDKFSYEFMLKYYYNFFENQPVFFVGMERYDKDEAKYYKLQDKIIGILERRAVEDILKTIHTLMPSLKKLYIINDKSSNADDTDVYLKKAMQQYTDCFEIEYIREKTLEKMQVKFSEYRENEAVFFIRFYNYKPGYLYKNHEISTFIDNVNIPVFVTDDLFIGKGPTGGKVIPIKQLGIDTGNAIINYFQNKLDKDFIETNETYEYVFDYEKVNKFNLDLSKLNVDYRFVNAPMSFFEKNREFINFVFVISPFLLFLILGLMHNLYLRIKSAKKLKQRMQFDKVLLNTINSPIVWEDEKGYIVDSNSKFNELLNMSCDEMQGKRLRDFVENQNVSNLFKLLKTFINKNAFDENELVLKSRDDKEHIYMINKTDYTENIYETRGTVVVFTDVTKEKLALREKIKHQEFIIQQSKLAEIGEIFSSIAHQWKTPLLEITTIAQEQIYSCEGKIDEENNTFVNDIMVQVKYMAETISDFQNFIMPSANKVSFDIYEAVSKMLEIMKHNIKYNYIKVNVNVNPNTNLIIYGYKNELMQTLLNIVNNAKDAIIKRRKQNIIKQGIINIDIKNIDDKVLIEIEDNGGGIPKEHINNVFEAYYTTKQNGHGIGLYMAKLIIEDKMDGKINVENTKNGAKFIIKLGVIDENIITRR
ncbi:ATP-binding protein [Malaciobacter mytili]|uniref:sensor histidine kinase n=1 Tax=Malaciobacter mytili TaxID=603050 RepID=UPI003BAF6218